MRFLGNAFSAGMLVEDSTVTFMFLDVEDARAWTKQEFSSCVGHADTAAIVSVLLDTPVGMNRSSTELNRGDELLVAQYNGPRLPEGATSLPEGAKIRWILATVH